MLTILTRQKAARRRAYTSNPDKDRTASKLTYARKKGKLLGKPIVLILTVKELHQKNAYSANADTKKQQFSARQSGSNTWVLKSKVRVDYSIEMLRWGTNDVTLICPEYSVNNQLSTITSYQPDIRRSNTSKITEVNGEFSFGDSAKVV